MNKERHITPAFQSLLRSRVYTNTYTSNYIVEAYQQITYTPNYIVEVYQQIAYMKHQHKQIQMSWQTS